MAQPTIAESAVPYATIVSEAVKSGEVIDIRVGTAPEPASFKVHKKLLVMRSDYFRRMLAGECIEAQTKSCSWDDEDPDVVSIFVSWLYTGELDLEGADVVHDVNFDSGLRRESAPELALDNVTSSLKQGSEHLLALLKLWVLADKRGIIHLANAVIDRLHEVVGSQCILPDEIDLIWVWENTVSSSKLRSLLVEYEAVIGIARDFNAAGLDIPCDMATRIIRRMGLYQQSNPKYNNTGVVRMSALDLCLYHEHPDGKNCRGQDMAKKSGEDDENRKAARDNLDYYSRAVTGAGPRALT